MTIEQWLAQGYLLVICEWGAIYRATLEKRGTVHAAFGATPEMALSGLRNAAERLPVEFAAEHAQIVTA